MNYLIYTLTLGIVLSTIVPSDKRWCNALDELQYSYRYSVDSPETGVISQHWEERRADLVHGSYSFLEPTGKIRVVEYTVTGDLGFKAAVTIRDPPPDYPLSGPLKFPDYFKGAIFLAEPVSFISDDLLTPSEIYPNLPG